MISRKNNFYIDRTNNEVVESKSKRLFIFYAVVYFSFFLIGMRLFQLQVLKGDQYQDLAYRNRFNSVFKIGDRKAIVDRNGKTIAGTTSTYSLFILPSACSSLNKALDQCSEHIAINMEQRKKILKNCKKYPSYYHIIFQNIDWESFAKLLFYLADKKEFFFAKRRTRFYPFNNCFFHSVGYVTYKPYDYVRDRFYISEHKYITVHSALEKKRNDFLIGNKSRIQVEVNSQNKIVRVIGQRNKNVVEMPNLPLTIDSDIQIKAYEILSQYKAGCIGMMNLKTGGMVTALSHPSLNPNDFIHGISRKQYDRISKKKNSPLLDRLVQGLYPPASVFKIPISAYLLEEDRSLMDYQYTCSGSFKIGKRVMSCWKEKGHGSMSLYSAIVESCDVCFYLLSNLLKKRKLHFICEKLGMFGTPLLHRRVANSILLNSQRNIYLGDWANISIGQGNIAFTPLSLLTMISRIAMGTEIVPCIELEYEKKSVEIPLLRGISKSSIQFIQNALYSACNQFTGTGYSAARNFKNAEIAGKTGTAQVVAKDSSLASIEQYYDHALFVGYAPFSDPRFSVVVVIDNGESGGRVAAPIACELLNYAVNKNVH